MSIQRPFSEADWLATPQPVRQYVQSLEQRVEQLEKSVLQLLQRIEQLESRLNQNSQNSNKPPSSDPPYQRPARQVRESKRRRGGQKGHKGHRQQMLKPTEILTMAPGPCPCGCTRQRVGSLRCINGSSCLRLPCRSSTWCSKKPSAQAVAAG